MPYDTICREILLNGYYEKELLIGMTAIVKNKSGTVLDIGANIGNHTIFFSRTFKQVISFEPVPRNCWILKANLHLNRITNVVLVEKALGDKNELQFLAVDDPYNTNNGLSVSPQGPNGTSKQVEVVRGDAALQEISYVAPISLIKVDVEGLENEVMGLEDNENIDQICWEVY
jgi:FkbM family methyltransferase